MMHEYFSPKQIARSIGVSESSLKRWCDKGQLPVVRTLGGHRRVALPDVIRFLKDQKIDLAHPEVLGLPPSTGSGPRTLARAAGAMARALGDGDEEGFRCVGFDLYLAGRPAWEIFDGAIAAAFREIGDAWQHGDLEVYQERRGCEICIRFLNQLRAILPQPGANAPLAVGGTLSRDVYTIPNAMCDLTLREAGWRTQSCGVGNPGATLAAAARDLQPGVFWVSVSWVDSFQGTRVDLETLHEATREVGAELLIGGHALTPELLEQFPHDAYCASMQELQDVARKNLKAAS